jgi:DNA-binding response OmpR family regulator
MNSNQNNNSNQLSTTKKPQIILLVDDEPSVHRFIGLLLSNSDKYVIISAFSGEEAIEKAKSLTGKIGLLLLDVMLPGIDGGTLYNKLQEIEVAADVPVIFQTGMHSNAVVEALVSEGKAELLRKPYKKDQLFAAIKAVLQKSDL